MNNIILIYSPSQRTGKTYLSRELVSRGIVDKTDSFALYIKKLAYDLHKSVSYHKLSKEEFYQTLKDDKILNGKSPRDLVCSLSDMIQEYYGQEIWADVLYSDIVSQKDVSNIVIDDWRRNIESDYLINKSEFNIIKVYLEKEGLKSKPSKGSSQYEGQILPESCDITFKYDKNYSNFEELIGLIQNALK